MIQIHMHLLKGHYHKVIYKSDEPAWVFRPLGTSVLAHHLVSNSAEVANALIKTARTRWDTQGNGEELSRIKTRIYDLKQQLEVLAERLSTLPKSLSPEPIYRQMEKLQVQVKTERKRFQALEQDAVQKTPPAELEVYEKFLACIRGLKDQDGAGFLKAKIVRSLIHKVEILPEGLRIHYRVGQDDIQNTKGGLAEMPGLPALIERKKQKSPAIQNFGSRSLTNGGA